MPDRMDKDSTSSRTKSHDLRFGILLEMTIRRDGENDPIAAAPQPRQNQITPQTRPPFELRHAADSVRTFVYEVARDSSGCAACEQAITFVPGKPQGGLQSLCIAGKPDFKIAPTGDDFYKRLIDLRSMVKTRMQAAKGQEKEELDAEQQALKILANSTSYGIFVEVNVGDLDKYEKRECFRHQRSTRGGSWDRR
jgi:hypothetical protein